MRKLLLMSMFICLFFVSLVIAGTVTVYSVASGDGAVNNETTDTWDNIHDSATGTVATPSDVDYIGASCGEYGAGVIWISRAFWPFYLDSTTTGIPDNATITAVTLNLYVMNVSPDTGSDLGIVETDQPDPTDLTTSDYNNCGATNNPTRLATDIALTSISNNQYNTWTLNSTGIQAVQDAHDGDTYVLLGTRIGYDMEDSDPSHDNTGSGVGFRSADYTGTSSDPYLSITYTVPTVPIIVNIQNQ